MVAGAQPQIMFFVRFKSSLPAEEVERRYKERLPQFREVPGLLQKYYVYDPATGEWGGCHIFDSQSSLDAYLASDLRKTIAETYQIAGEPRVETITIADVLRP